MAIPPFHDSLRAVLRIPLRIPSRLTVVAQRNIPQTEEGERVKYSVFVNFYNAQQRIITSSMGTSARTATNVKKTLQEGVIIRY